MTKEELALQIVKRLKEAYPDVDCTLEYDQAWKLLVACGWQPSAPMPG